MFHGKTFPMSGARSATTLVLSRLPAGPSARLESAATVLRDMLKTDALRIA
jgi:hypothetical protein